MCGRFTFFSHPDRIRDDFDLADVPFLVPRHNIAPTQPVAAVRLAAGSDRRELVLLRWGLIPSWAADPAAGDKHINARAETFTEKPSYHSARRCLIPADGFYEWQQVGGRKQPFYFRLCEERPFAFAGLWDRWSQGGEVIESCSILTTAANDLVRPIHDRMPVMLHPAFYGDWLDPARRDFSRLLQPYSAEAMATWPVSSFVNSPQHDEPRCIERVRGK